MRTIKNRKKSKKNNFLFFLFFIFYSLLFFESAGATLVKVTLKGTLHLLEADG
jgi:hypothetical protein